MRGALVIAALIALPAVALANDTQVVLTGRGVRFAKSASIAMEREDLRLSPDEVRVAYVFRNRGPAPITTEVAFPLPDLDVGDLSETPHTFHLSGRDGDVVDFRLTINGKPAAATLEARAFNQKGVDITPVLRSLGIPLVGARADDEIEKALDALKPAGMKRLLAAGAGYADELQGGDTLRHPRWIVHAAYHWRQTFPAGAPVRIEHRYRPVLGEIVFDKFADLLPDNALGALGEWPDEHRSWCATPALIAAAGDAEAKARVRWLEYILKTGANWAGPIGAFHLEIAPPPGATASTCPIHGLVLRRQGHFLVADRAAFTPTSDLAVLFLSPSRGDH